MVLGLLLDLLHSTRLHQTLRPAAIPSRLRAADIPQGMLRSDWHRVRLECLGRLELHLHLHAHFDFLE